MFMERKRGQCGRSTASEGTAESREAGDAGWGRYTKLSAQEDWDGISTAVGSKVQSKRLVRSILLLLHPGQRLLLGINKSWGFLSSQLSGGGTWKEGRRSGRWFLGSRAAHQMAADPMQVPRPPRAAVLLLGSWQVPGVESGGVCRELGVASRGTVAPCWGLCEG